MKHLIVILICTSFLMGGKLFNRFKTGEQIFTQMGCWKCHGKKAEKSALGRSRVVSNLSKMQILAKFSQFRKSSDPILRTKLVSLTRKDKEKLAQYMSSLGASVCYGNKPCY